METKIKAVLREKRMTVHQMHREVGGNRSHCYQVASGVCRAPVPMREKIAAFLGLQVDELFDEYGMARK
jgi:DNA-binding XRE family transcriptional regulator